MQRLPWVTGLSCGEVTVTSSLSCTWSLTLHPVPQLAHAVVVCVGEGSVERGPDTGADRTGTDNCDLHGGSPFGKGPSEGTGGDVKSTEYCLQYVFKGVKGVVKPPSLGR